MAVHWDCSECALHHSALAKANESGTFDHTVKEWDEYTDLREALIWALLITKFPNKSDWKITEKNWEEVYRRLHILERVSGAYRMYHMGKDQPDRKMYFTPEEVHSMIGMSVNSGTQTEAEFKTYIYKQLAGDANRSLAKYKEELQ
jgi:hypothetical protein